MKKNHNFYKSINISAFIKNILILCIFYFFTFQSSFAQLNNDKLKNDKIDKDKLTEQLNNKPFTFMENKGQWPEEVLFMANTKSLRAWITKKAMVFEQFEENKNASNNPFEDTLRNKEIKTHVTGLEFVNPKQVKVQKFNPIVTKYNFMIGNDPSKHAKDVAAFENVKIENIYEGIDMKYYFDNGELRYDYIVKPNADPNQIELEIKGGDSFRIVNGELIIETSLNPVIKKELFAYQNDKLDNTKKNKVNSEFTLIGNKLKFNIGNYDKTQELVIDPIVWSGFLFNGFVANSSNLRDMLINDNYETLFIGSTNSNSFPEYYGTGTSGGFDLVFGLFTNQANHSYSTFFGGNSDEEGTSFDYYKVGYNYRLCITGYTKSNNIPIDNLNGNYYNNLRYGATTTFFATFDYNQFGATLLYSTYLKNADNDEQYLKNSDLRVNSEGKIFISSTTNKSITPAFTELNQITSQNHTITNSNYKGCIYSFEPTMNGLNLNYNCVFSSLFSGNNLTTISTIDIDEKNNIYIAGISKSLANTFNFTNNSYRKTQNPLFVGNRYVFFTKLNFSTNLNIQYNSILFEETIANPTENIYANDIFYYNNRVVIAGSNHKNNNLVFVNAFDNTRSMIDLSLQEAYLSVVELNNQGTNDLIYSSYFGGTEVDGFLQGSVIHDVDYNPYCDKIIFVGSTISELNDYTGTIGSNATFSQRFNLFAGVVDLSLSNVNTLTELGYANADPSNFRQEFGIAISYDKMLGGFKTLSQNRQNFIIRTNSNLSCEMPCPCTEDRDDWITINSITDSPDCLGQCKIIVNFSIPSQYQNCYLYYDVNVVLYDNVDSEFENINIVNQNVNLNHPILNICVPPGVNYEITIILHRYSNDPSACIITRNIYCPIDPEPQTACKPDCPEDNWVTQEDILVPLAGCPGCMMNISYVSRKACNGSYQDIQVTNIDLIKNNPNGDCDACTREQIYQQAIREIIEDNAMGFEPLNGTTGCFTNWRISMASCWATYYVYSWSPSSPLPKIIKRLSPCNSECCSRAMRVCRNNQGVVTIEELGLIGTYANCDNVTKLVPGGGTASTTAPCEFTCDVLEGMNLEYFKQSENYEDLTEEYSNQIRNTKVILNSYNDNNNIYLDIKEKNFVNLTVKIYNLNGSLIKDKKFNKNQISIPITIEINELISNFYFYEIIVDGITIQTNKFIKE
jgi:hypothetical protein